MTDTNMDKQPLNEPLEHRLLGGYLDLKVLGKAAIYTGVIALCAYAGQEIGYEFSFKILNAGTESQPGLVRITEAASHGLGYACGRAVGALAGGVGGFIAARRINR